MVAIQAALAVIQDLRVHLDPQQVHLARRAALHHRQALAPAAGERLMPASNSDSGNVSDSGEHQDSASTKDAGEGNKEDASYNKDSGTKEDAGLTCTPSCECGFKCVAVCMGKTECVKE